MEPRLLVIGDPWARDPDEPAAAAPKPAEEEDDGAAGESAWARRIRQQRQMIDATNLERATTRVNAELLRYQRDEMEAADREEADGPGRLVTFDARAAGDADYTLRIQVARYKLYRGRQETLCVACGREPDAREHTRPSRGWEMFGDHA